MDSTSTDGPSSEEQQPRRGPKHQNRVAVLRDLLKSLPAGRLLDLATGHGKFAITAHNLGWQVTAVDARTERMPMTDGIEWIQSDVRQFPTDGYDVITILGLLYHLDLPDQIDLLTRCSNTLTIVDTHISMEPDSTEDDYLGHYYEERGGLASSWGNPTAFWPTEDSLFRMFEAGGYTNVLKVLPFPVRRDRTFYVLSKGHDDARLERLVTAFNATSEFTLEPQRALRGNTAETIETLASERDAAIEKLDRLRSRKSVRLAVAVAGVTAPVYRWLRR